MEEKFKIRPSGDISSLDDIARNLSNLYSAREGSIPLNRNFGLDWGILSSPTPECESEFTLDVISKTEEFEPRVIVTEVTYEYDGNGKVIPTIYFEERGEED